MPQSPPPLADANWSEQEKWVWNQIVKGEIANLNEFDKASGEFDPKQETIDESKWGKRILTPKFLQTVLAKEEYANEHTHKGVQITGAWVR